jgi:hypothetical protein
MTLTLTRFPKRRFYGELMQTSMHGLQSLRDINNKTLDEIGYTGRRLFGYKLPEWQRKPVWTDEQCVLFIESIWMGVGLGAFMVNLSNTGLYDDTHLILLDGQQRLRAIERYWNGEFAVPGEDGNSYLWTDFTEREQAHFNRMPFPWLCTAYTTDAELREAYNRHNFGGTAHKEDERA